MSKRGSLARGLKRSGLLNLLEAMKGRPGLYIPNYHRIGDRTMEPFDREVYSGTVEEFDWHIRYLKRHMPLLHAEELEEIVTGRRKLDRLYGALTFDDGYLDNYTNAFEVMKANKVSGTFFLVPEYVGSATVTWWDEIAYLVRNTSAAKLQLSVPFPLTVATDPDREAAIVTVLKHYKHPENHDTDAFMAELRTQAGCSLPAAKRQFLSWDEAREMQQAGMTIGSHTQSHRILSQLTEEQQRWELGESKRVLESELGHSVRSLAYPVGSRSAFTSATESIAKELGYTMSFSFYGGVQLPVPLYPMNIQRCTLSSDKLMARVETMLLTRFGKLPY